MQDSTVLGYTDRIIDIDIVFYDNIKFQGKNLRIPHFKHVNEREFSKKLLTQLDDLKIKHNI